MTPPARFPPPLEALGAIFAPVPYPRLARLGSDTPEDAPDARLWDLVSALLRNDRPAAQSVLAELDREPQAWEAARSPWWLGVGSFLLDGLSGMQLDGRLPPAIRLAFLADSVACRARSAAAVEASVTLVGWLEAAGLPTVVLKGVGTAAWLYPEAWRRPCGDVDLLVLPADHAAAVSTLVARGCAREGTPGDAASGERPLRLSVRGHPFLVEVHHELHPLGAGARLDTDRILATRTTLSVGTAVLPVPAEPVRLAHLLLHHPGELDFRHVLDLLLASRAAGPDGLRRARRELPAPQRWLADLVAGMAADLGGLDVVRAVPATRRLLIRRLCVARWGRAFVLRARHRAADATPTAGVAEAVRRPLALGGHRLRQQAALCVSWTGQAARSLPTRGAALPALLRDVSRFVFPPRREFARRSGRSGWSAYLANSALAAKSLASRACSALSPGG